jgi:general secretion pathway protein G
MPKKTLKVVLAAIGVAVLCAALVVIYVGYQEHDQIFRGRLYRAKSDIAAMDSAIDEFYKKQGRYPQDFDEIVGAELLPKKIPLDPWGNPYRYKRDIDGKGYDVIAKPDRQTQEKIGLAELSNRTDWQAILK